ncbi:MAG TPA: non-ribosomal peptide synthetase, partial [Eubacterium sp.]|nr:non-ribosomal peptide synthetase [Eubacterium sp.]
KTIAEIFEEQVEKTPDNVAVVFEDERLTYAQLNNRANQLAKKLVDQGVKPGDYVALYIERSIEMVVGIYGIIKAGAVYVPINTMYPDDRVEYILKDCNAGILLLGDTKLDVDYEGKRINLKEEKLEENECANPEILVKPESGLYVIYTSGTTGKPKGCEVMHKNVVRLLFNDEFEFDFNEDDVWTMFHSYGFDFSVWEMYGATLYGGKLVVVSEDEATDTGKFLKILKEQKVTVLNQVPTAFYNLDYEDKGEDLCVRYLIFGGEALDPSKLRGWKKKHPETKIINMYGITETTVHVTYREIGEEEIERGISDIGRAIPTLNVYIMNGDTMCGIGMPGELCVTGEGLAKGYLNRPELTAEKFVKNPFGEGRMYRSGDLARWLPDGNIEYLGRIDEQVKIRGFRIELGEIESRIREIEGIRDAAVIARKDNSGSNAIYAYFVAEDGGKEISLSDIRETLSINLPDYMIPAYIMQIEAIPVTKNGKLDRRALPDIEAKTEKEYIAPRNELEKSICEIFSELLGVEKVGVKDGFFELGGHSLRATRLVNRIEEQTGKRIALKDVFSNQTPEKIAMLVNSENEDEYESIPKAEEKEYYPMSSAQKRTYITSQIDSAAVLYNIPEYHQVRGEINIEAMNAAFQKIVDRHEILRTSFMVVDGEAVQKIIPHVDVKIDYVDYDEVKDLENEDDLYFADEFVKPFDLSNPPLVRIQLINRGEYHLMCTDMHHIISDGMSFTTFINELVALYNGEELKPLTRQFKDYSEWMRTRDLSSQADYWKSQFEGDIPVFDMPYDHIRPQEKTYKGGVVAYGLGVDLTQRLRKLVSDNEVTDYMLFMAATMVLLSKYSYQEDIVVGTPISGRTHKDTEQMIGMFVNTLAMRGRPEKDKTFREFLMEIKDMCFKAYENQDYPFDELVEAVGVDGYTSRNPLFDVMFVLQNNDEGTYCFNGLEFDWVEREPQVSVTDLSFTIGTRDDKFEVVLGYTTDLIEKESARKIYFHYFDLLNHLDENIDKKIGDIDIVSDREKALIINKFNDMEVNYPKNKTIAEIFEEQVEKNPENIAVVFEDKEVSYKELNEAANALGHKLRDLGVYPDDFVAIITDRSLEMIEAIFGVLKSGGTYLPIDPT